MSSQLATGTHTGTRRTLTAVHPPAQPGTQPMPGLDKYIYGVAAVLGGSANVVMQLSHAPVGYGVMESKVDSGNITKHPVKRARTTLTYLIVALTGTDDERREYRDAVNTAHRQVHSRPGSPVRYNAFDRNLQLWVALCLYRGLQDTMSAMGAHVSDEVAEQIYQEASRFATTLQVPASMWPADRAAFNQAFDAGIAEATFDEPVRRYLLKLVGLEILPLPLRVVAAPVNRFFTAGFLPPELRAAMDLPWSDNRQRLFDGATHTIGFLTRHAPGPIRKFPMNAYLLDMRIRSRLGKPLV